MKKCMSVLMTIAMLAMMCCNVVFAYGNINPKVEAPSGANTTASTIIGVMQWFG